MFFRLRNLRYLITTQGNLVYFRIFHIFFVSQGNYYSWLWKKFRHLFYSSNISLTSNSFEFILIFFDKQSLIYQNRTRTTLFNHFLLFIFNYFLRALIFHCFTQFYFAKADVSGWFLVDGFLSTQNFFGTQNGAQFKLGNFISHLFFLSKYVLVQHKKLHNRIYDETWYSII